MRVNVYNEELTSELEVIRTTSDTGRIFTGVRFLLASSPRLHATEQDDDRSAVTLWADDPRKLRDLLQAALRGLDAAVAG